MLYFDNQLVNKVLAENLGQTRDIFGSSANEGYNRASAEVSAVDLNSLNVANAVEQNASPSFIDSLFSSVDGNGLTANLTGIDHVSSAPQVQMSDHFNVDASAQTNMTSQVSLQSNLADIGNAKAGLASSIGDIQRTFTTILEVAAENTDIPQGAMNVTFGADSNIISTGELMATSFAASTGMPLVQKVQTASTIQDAIGTVRSVAGGLTSEQEAKLADEIRSIVSQTTNSPEMQMADGQNTQPAVGFPPKAVEYLTSLTNDQLIATIQQVMVPPAFHPDMIALDIIEAETEQALSVHQKYEYETQMAVGLGSQFSATEEVSLGDIELFTSLQEARITLIDPDLLGVNAPSVPTNPLFVANLDSIIREKLQTDPAEDLSHKLHAQNDATFAMSA